MGEISIAKENHAAPFRVEWVGAQREVLAGDVSGHISLGSLAGLPDLYALGPLEGLRGEVTVVDSVASISRVAEAGRIVIDPTFHHEACFLAYAQVARWVEVTWPSSVRGEAELEWFLPEAAASIGVDPGAPFPYLLKGRLRAAKFHVLNRTDDLPHNRERHEQVKAHFRLGRGAATVIGFYSGGHRGVFTPGDRSIHQHVVTADGTVAGHVDSISLTPEVRLFLPDPSMSREK